MHEVPNTTIWGQRRIDFHDSHESLNWLRGVVGGKAPYGANGNDSDPLSLSIPRDILGPLCVFTLDVMHGWR